MANPSVRTAPLWTATATRRLVTLGLIDASGDLWSESMYVPVASTAANLEAWAAAYAAASQASLYSLGDFAERVGDADPDNADTLQRNSVGQGLNNSLKNLTTNATVTGRIVAPIPALLQGNQDIPLTTAAEYIAYLGSLTTLLTGYGVQSAQYTERRERKNNPKIKV